MYLHHEEVFVIAGIYRDALLAVYSTARYVTPLRRVARQTLDICGVYNWEP